MNILNTTIFLDAVLTNIKAYGVGRMYESSLCVCVRVREREKESKNASVFL